MRAVLETLRIGTRLDRRWAELRGEMAISKEQSIVELARLLGERRVPYAVIGGVAVQIWSREPRTTLDVDLAVRSYDDIPGDALEASGFSRRDRHDHSENWVGPDRTPIQFTDDPEFAAAIDTSAIHSLGDVTLRIAPVAELIRAKLRAARDPASRRSKRLMDIADAAMLAEQHPDAVTRLSAAEKHQLDT